MQVTPLPNWGSDAIVAARSHPAEYVEVAQWIMVAKHTDFTDERPLAIVGVVHAVFQFETAHLCVLAHGHAGRLTLTHIFVLNGQGSVAGKRARVLAVANAMNISVTSVSEVNYG